MTWASVLALCADDCMLHSLPSTRFAVVISQLPPFHRDLPCPAFPSAEQTHRPSVSIKMKRSRRTKGPGLRQGCAQRWKSSASFPRPRAGSCTRRQPSDAISGTRGRGAGQELPRPRGRAGDGPEQSPLPGTLLCQGGAAGRGSGPRCRPRAVPSGPAPRRTPAGSCPFSTSAGPGTKRGKD